MNRSDCRINGVRLRDCDRFQIRGLSVNEAMAQMQFSDKKRGPIIAHGLKRAMQKADFYHELTSDDMMVAEAFVGKDGRAVPKLRYHSKGECVEAG